MKKFKKSPSQKSSLPALQGESQSLHSGIMPAMLYLEQFGNYTHGLTPSRLRRILESADMGDISEQHQLFADMEDRCDHLAAEIGKRKRALLTLDWEIVPARKNDKEAQHIADAVRELYESLFGFEDMLMDMADGIGHGFAALELTWGFEGGLHVPVAFTHRPQSWFQCLRNNRNQLHLRDGSVEGAELWPFGWLVHTHRSKSGWLPRIGLFRALAWTYLIRAYAQESSVNYTQVHGMPLRLGKYPAGSSEEDKTALMTALRYLGRDAAGIIPTGMEILFQSPSVATRDIPSELVTRCEQGMSKAILGGTLTSQADGKSSTNALGSVHNEVRHDLLVSDALQIANTISRQLLAPLALLNFGITDTRLLPYFRFDTREAEDISAMAEALPKLAPIMRISKQWAHDKLKIPEAANDNDVLGAQDVPAETATKATATRMATTQALENIEANDGQDAIDNIHADAALTSAAQSLLAPLMAEVQAGLTAEQLQGRLVDLYPLLDESQLAEVLAQALFVAEVWGRLDASI